ncbi:Na/Pi cotransporter family protein [Bittarella massiliensis (ex Durand et al. 2017)]|uniref:Na/Pi cotransporter family protein n=1 Tax=Bittarella massiliensis (ex Durand et al. 2017) TaxID=1720313 RepID=UPI001AA0F6AE|nr:Na/Pi cotransporter family protein [Bittarella massiliensis (ex Durand et al. 2017)]MBO1680757.1 Na/Pi cotransporter family protein [Bittarella massiliensis (ex Durand et al. 2017)]
MNFFNFLSLAGGLAMFLYGMNIMGSGLEKLAGSKLEIILTKMTSNIFKSVLLGALITAVIQSSSATTVIVVGLVNSGILKLDRAIGIIMGANIGTTITAQILALGDISSSNFFLQLVKPTALAPMMAAIGIVFFMFLQGNKQKNLGQILMGFGILFIGMQSMEGSMAPLRDLPQFADILTALSNPILGVLAGTILTAVIQSSSASVGILQAVSSTGQLRYSTAIPIIMGQNIGTCITAILASIGANKNAKRAAAVHLYFNVIGTTVFLTAIYAIQHLVGFGFWNEAITRADIANFHTIFNICTTVLLVPFYKVLGKLAEMSIRSKKGEEDLTPEVPLLDERLLASPGLAIEQARSVVLKMGEYGQKNCSKMVSQLFSYDQKTADSIAEYESAIDKMEVTLSRYLLKLTNQPLSDQESRQVSEMFWLVTEFERIGDYAINVLERGGEIADKKVVLSDMAKGELIVLDKAIGEILGKAVAAFRDRDVEVAREIEPLEETIDQIKDELKAQHIERLKQGTCSIDAGVIFLEILTNLERIADHCSNIAAYVVGYEGEQKGDFDAHQYRQTLHDGREEEYNRLYQEYSEKYSVH